MGANSSKPQPVRYESATYEQHMHKHKEPVNKFERIGDDFETLEQVQEALRENGLESSNLIIGVDFTSSNNSAGKRTFGGKSLHHVSNVKGELNPYEKAIFVIGKTLSEFDEDNLIPCYGFGDYSTGDKNVFSFWPGERPCNGMEEALERYRYLAQHVHFYGPTSFVPLIDTAIRIVEESGGQYHVLLIIADGQVTDEAKNKEAIRRASNYPLSIVMVGVGDGPWDSMEVFDDEIPGRKFDNFQFVDFHKVIKGDHSDKVAQAIFAKSALMEVPAQYRATLELKLLGRNHGSCPSNVTRPPPC